MGGLSSLFGGGKKNVKPEFTALQLQTSASILAIPIVWGMARIAPNLLFYDGFNQVPVSGKDSGKGGVLGGGGSSSSSSQSYRADIALALCEGPIHGIGLTWHDRLQFPVIAGPGEGGSYIPIFDSSDGYTSFLFIFYGEDPTKQFTWGYFSGAYPEFVLAFPWTAYLAAAQFDLGSSATVGELNVEVQGVFYGTVADKPDAEPARVINDFLTNVQYGAQFDPTLIDTTTLFAAEGMGATVEDYCRATGICFSPALIDQEQASSILTRWLQILNCAAVWSGAKLKVIPYGDTAIASGTVQTASVTLAVPGNPDNIPGGFGFGSVDVAPPGNFVADLGVKYVEGGNLIFAGATIPAGPAEYGSIGTTYYFNQYDIGSAVTISFTYANVGSFTPNLTPLFSLDDDDYLDPGGNDDPLTIERVDPYTLPTIQRIEVLSRNNQYASVPVEARDQGQIEILGPRVATTISAHEICDEIVVGPIVAQLILQRALYVRATYHFKTDWTFSMLDPMDIIALNDSALGLVNYPVRVVSIEEDDNGLLDFVCEELPSGISTAPLYTNAGVTPTNVNISMPAFPVNWMPPLIYEVPSAIAGSAAQLWLGASSSIPATGAADPNWGGCNVWASLDDATYALLAVILGATPQGFLTGSFASASGWDTTHTLSVDLTISGGTLATTTEAAAQAGATLCLVDNELLAFETATLTAPNKYDLTNIQRGLFGSTPASHVAGAAFTYVASKTVLSEIIPPQWAGTATIYFKFQSFNMFHSGGQDLSKCTAYVFVPGGTSDPHPVATLMLGGGPLDFGLVSDTPTLSDDFGRVGWPPVETVDLGNSV